MRHSGYKSTVLWIVVHAGGFKACAVVSLVFCTARLGETKDGLGH